MWVSAKGYPAGTGKTSPSVQARHWFSHALFDLVLWRGENRTVQVGLALPGKKDVSGSCARVRWFLEEVDASIYWVSEGEHVEVERFLVSKERARNDEPAGGWESGRRAGVVKAYFDESERQSGLLCVGGYVFADERARRMAIRR